MRWLLWVGLLGCGAAPAKRVPLPEGRALYTVRLNPAPCMGGRPDLHFEVQTPQGWERVALDPPAEGDEDLVAALQERFAQTPDAALVVDARFTSELVAWSGRHQSRVLRLIAVDPEAPGEP